jgi:hypothetical protein
MNPTNIKVIEDFFNADRATWDVYGDKDDVNKIAKSIATRRLQDNRNPNPAMIRTVVTELNAPFPGHIHDLVLYLPVYKEDDPRYGTDQLERMVYRFDSDVRPIDVLGAIYTHVQDNGGIDVMGDYTGLEGIGYYPMQGVADGVAPIYLS